MPDVPTIRSLGSSLPSIKYPLLIEVLHAISDGKTPTRACEERGLTLASLRYAIKADDELAAMFKEALEIGNDALADTLVDIDRVHSEASMANVISKNIQWLLERRNPDKYGARVTVNSENNVSKALVAALDAAIHRIPIAHAPQEKQAALLARPVTIDVEVEYVERKVDAPHPSPGSAASEVSLETLRSLGLI